MIGINSEETKATGKICRRKEEKGEDIASRLILCPPIAREEETQKHIHTERERERESWERAPETGVTILCRTVHHFNGGFVTASQREREGAGDPKEDRSRKKKKKLQMKAAASCDLVRPWIAGTRNAKAKLKIYFALFRPTTVTTDLARVHI